METNITAQEILIMHNSRFFSKEFFDKDSSTGKKHSPTELLAEACWNGLITEALPEIASSLSLIKVNEGGCFLDLQYGQYETVMEKELSLNPYLFMDTNIHLN